MKKSFFLIPLVAILFAAASNVNAQDYNKAEAFGTFTLQKIGGDAVDAIDAALADEGLGKIPKWGKGFTGGFTANFNRFVGAKAEVGYTKINIAKVGSNSVGLADFSLMGGIQIKDNSKDSGSRVRPFAHVLAGMTRNSVTSSGDVRAELIQELGTAELTKNSFSMAFGGGIDVKVSERVSIRAIQADFKPVFGGDINTDGIGTVNNFRLSFGLVIH